MKQYAVITKKRFVYTAFFLNSEQYFCFIKMFWFFINVLFLTLFFGNYPNLKELPVKCLVVFCITKQSVEIITFCNISKQKTIRSNFFV
jgi:hypothetical protein